MTQVNNTLPLAQADRLWDVLVLGAGPAGVVAATLLARRGYQVLLVDKARFPRHKVCGGCLNQAALAALRQADLLDPILAAGARPIHAMHLAVAGRHAHLQLPAGLAVTRYAMDAALLHKAIEQGVELLTGTRAQRMSDGAVQLRISHATGSADLVHARARLILQCDGLRGSVDPHDAATVHPNTWMGVGTILPDAMDAFAQPGVIHMACAEHGYAGLVRTEGGTINLAAAIRPDAARTHGSLTQALAAILHASGMPDPGLTETLDFHGVGGLTRHRQQFWFPGGMVVGDAGGYVEPFTGEGMAWAAGSAVLLQPLAMQAIEHGWSNELGHRWQVTYTREVASRHRHCAMVAGLLRKPRLLALIVSVLGWCPWLGGPTSRRINRPFSKEFT